MGHNDERGSMPDNDHQLTVPLLERGITRRKMLLTTGGALAGVLLVGCGGGGGQEGEAPEESAPPVAGSFVGEVPDTDAFVAVVAVQLEQGEDEREVLVYLCDGRSIYEWFKGSAAGNDEFSLTATDWEPSQEGGAEVETVLTPEAATGTFTLPDGRSLPFEAAPATGVAGLYQATFLSDGRLSGTSERGGQLDARVAGEDESGIFRITGTVTGPDGESVPFEFLLQTDGRYPDPGGEFRAIVLPDGQSRGKGKPAGGTGFSYNGPLD